MSQFCSECGAPARPNVRFCTACGHAVIVRPIDSEADSPRSDLPIIAGIGALLIVIGGGAYFMMGKANTPGTADDMAVAADAAQAITGEQTEMYVVADANVRDQPTAKGTAIVGKQVRGAQLSGIMQVGVDGQSRWFKLADGSGYVSAVNLRTSASPTLSRTLTDFTWYAAEATDLLAWPVAGSENIAHLNPSEAAVVAGVTKNGYAEVKLAHGGVGYFLVTDSNDPGGILSGNASAAAAAPDTGAVNPFALANGAKLTFHQAIADQDITVEKAGPGAYPANAFGRIWYRNTVTGRSCSSHLVYDGQEPDWFAVFRQEGWGDDTVCPRYAKVKFGAGHEGMPFFSWWLDGKQVMSGSFE